MQENILKWMQLRLHPLDVDKRVHLPIEHSGDSSDPVSGSLGAENYPVRAGCNTTCELPPKATPKFAGCLDLDRMALSFAFPA